MRSFPAGIVGLSCVCCLSALPLVVPLMVFFLIREEMGGERGEALVMPFMMIFLPPASATKLESTPSGKTPGTFPR